MRLPFFEGRTVTMIVAAALGVLAVTGGIGAIRSELGGKASAASNPDEGLAALHRRHDNLAQRLAARPLDAQDWMTLAAVRHSLAMTPDSIDKAFAMSGLTGPAEGNVMAQRALFGILLWETSAAETRARTLTDLCGLTIHDPSRLKLALSAKTEAVRAAIRNGLLDHACAPRMVTVIGL